MSGVMVSCKSNTPQLDERSRYLRRLAVRMLDRGERGHIGSMMTSCVTAHGIPIGGTATE